MVRKTHEHTIAQSQSQVAAVTQQCPCALLDLCESHVLRPAAEGGGCGVIAVIVACCVFVALSQRPADPLLMGPYDTDIRRRTGAYLYSFLFEEAYSEIKPSIFAEVCDKNERLMMSELALYLNRH